MEKMRKYKRGQKDKHDLLHDLHMCRCSYMFIKIFERCVLDRVGFGLFCQPSCLDFVPARPW